MDGEEILIIFEYELIIYVIVDICKIKCILLWGIMNKILLVCEYLLFKCENIW